MAEMSKLEDLSISGNGYTDVRISGEFYNLITLNLDDNDFDNLEVLEPLRACSKLRSIKLKGNRISTVLMKLSSPTTANPIFGACLEQLDLSNNLIRDWNFIDQLSTAGPALHELRVSRNPLYDHSDDLENEVRRADDDFMLTLARIKDLQTLNFSQVGRHFYADHMS